MMGCKGEVDSGTNGDAPVINFKAGDVALEKIKIGNVEFDFTEQVYVTGKDGAIIEGKTNIDNDPGVFVEGRKVKLSPFIMSKYEVTQELYTAVLTGEVFYDYLGNPNALNPSPFVCTADSDDYKFLLEDEVQKYRPAENMTWQDAVYFCNVLSEKTNLTKAYDITIIGRSISITFVPGANGYRLPTIAEWEYLARGGNLTDNGQTLYSGSDTLNNVAWVSSNSSSYVHTVKMKQKNALGLYDMSGNVFELCWDRKGTINTSTPVTGPLTTEYNHYALGGCWDQDNTYAYVNYTQSYERTLTRFSNRGFRVVRNASSHTCLVKFDTTTNWPGNTRRVSSQIIDAGDTAVAPATTNPAPTAADAMHGNFLGWYTKPKPSQNPANPNAVQITPIDSPFDFNTPITSDITLYAVWDFVYVTGATFDSSQTLCDGDSDRQSAVFIGGQEITINSLYVCDHEVTQGEYEKYCCYTYDNTYKPS